MKLKYNDSMHAYWLDGKRCKSVTSVAKIPEDTFRLEQWSQRQVAIGLAMKPSLLETIAANVDDNSKINAICEKAAAEAGAHEGRDRGDALHKALEQHDTGKRFIPTDLTSSAIKSWEDILDARNWRVDLVERCVIWPDQKIAGRFDRTVRGDPCKECSKRIFILDYKSGAKVLNYPHAIACQLALYANAPLIAGPIPGEGGETEDIEDFEGVCACRAYVVHLPPDSDAQLIEINISFALPVINDIIFPTIAWRAHPAKSLAKVIDLDLPVSASTNDDDPFAGLPSPKVPEPVLERPGWVDFELLINLKRRLVWLKDNKPQQARVLRAQWPFPGVKVDDLDTNQIIDIIALLEPLERVVEAPFDPPPACICVRGSDGPDESCPTHGRPSPAPVQPQPLVNSTPADPAREPLDLSGSDLPPQNLGAVDEGPMMTPADIEAFKATFAELSNESKRRINEWAKQAHDSGTPISMRDVPSKRRFSIGRLCLLAVDQHEDVIRAVLGLVLGDEIQPVITTGSVMGVLTQQEAEKCWDTLLGLGVEWRYDVATRRLVAA